MVRIFKNYDLPLAAPATAARRISFSSYPVPRFFSIAFFFLIPPENIPPPTPPRLSSHPHTPLCVYSQGALYSGDDFITMPDSGLVVLETTNDIFNNSLYDLVKPTGMTVLTTLID